MPNPKLGQPIDLQEWLSTMYVWMASHHHHGIDKNILCEQYCFSDRTHTTNVAICHGYAQLITEQLIRANELSSSASLSPCFSSDDSVSSRPMIGSCTTWGKNRKEDFLEDYLELCLLSVSVFSKLLRLCKSLII